MTWKQEKYILWWKFQSTQDPVISEISKGVLALFWLDIPFSVLLYTNLHGNNCPVCKTCMYALIFRRFKRFNAELTVINYIFDTYEHNYMLNIILHIG